MPLEPPKPGGGLGGIITYDGAGGEVSFRRGSDGSSLWATRDEIAKAFQCSVDNVSLHIANIYKEGELSEGATSEESSEVRSEGKRNIKRAIDLYNLDLIIAVGYRVSTRKGTEFRQWATSVVSDHTLQGFSVNFDRHRTDTKAQEDLATILRQIRTSEAAVYQRVRDVFKYSATDYDANSQAAKTFFAMAQDKFHYAITGKTAAEIKLERANAASPNMGLRFCNNIPTIAEAQVAKNYLTAEELRNIENLSEQFMLFTESKVLRGQKMTMEDLSFKLKYSAVRKRLSSALRIQNFSCRSSKALRQKPVRALSEGAETSYSQGG